MRKSSDHGDIFILITLILYGIVFNVSKSSIPVLNADTSCYIGLSESIAESKNYNFNFIPHTKYPPGYPLFLSLFRIFYENSYYSVFITATAFLALIGVFASYLLLKCYSPLTAILVTFLLITSPGFFFMATTTILSDLPYFTFSMTALLSSLRLWNSNLGYQKHICNFIFTFTLIASVMTRTIGIMLPFGFVLWLFYSFVVDKHSLLQRLKFFSMPLILCSISIAAWFWWSESRSVIQYPGQYMDSYFAQMRLVDPHRPELGLASAFDLIIRISKNAILSISYISGLVTHIWITPSPVSVFIVPIIALLVIGIGYRIFFGKADFVLWYFCSYMGMILLWPFDEGIRFSLPVFPLACLYVFEGAKAIVRFSFKKLLLRVALLLTFLFSLPSLYLLLGGKARGIQEQFSCLLWISLTFVFAIILISNNHFIPNNVLKNLLSNNYVIVNRWFKRSIYAVVIMFCIIGIINELHIAYNNIKFKTDYLQNYPFIRAAEWLKHNIPDNSTICATQKEIIFQQTGIKTVPFPVSSSPDLLINTFKKLGAQYLIVYDEGKFPYFYPTDKERYLILSTFAPNLLTCIHEEKNFQIYKIDRKVLHIIKLTPGL